MHAKPPIVHVGRQVYIAQTAYVGGDVILGDNVTVMHHVTIRGDIAPIRVGNRSNVQDGAVLHNQYGVALDIAEEVSIAHRAVVHCREVGRHTLIGIGAVLLNDVVVGPDCIVAAGAVVTPGTRIPAGTLVAGVPARIVREVTDEDRREISRVAAVYVELGGRHAAGEFPNFGGGLSTPPVANAGIINRTDSSH